MVAGNYIADVPKELGPNLQFRAKLLGRANRDVGFQRAMMLACRDDVLFFFNAFCWLYEPRPVVKDGKVLPNKIPFITWPHQDPVIIEMDTHLGLDDIGLEKSRGEGASWISCLLVVRRWLFHRLSAFGLVSKDQDSASNTENPDSLLWKILWELEQLPKWMVPDFKSTPSTGSLRNLENGSTVACYAATANVASGGRKLAFVMDELAKFPRDKNADREALASTQHVTNSRLVVSTPKGSDGAYYELMHEPSNMVRLILDWKQNPVRNRSLYRFVEGRPVAVDPEKNPLLEGYEGQTALFGRLRRKGFQLEKGLRSPWYDRECDRPGATPQSIAEELDRNYGGSEYRIFGHDFFAKAEEGVRVPFARGEVHYSAENFECNFHKLENGPVLLWTQLDVRDRPPDHNYIVAADIGAGLGGSYSSNSVLTVVDATIGEQVLEYAANTIKPAELADMGMAMATWFHGAYLAWERNGPGGGFTARVKERGYGNVMYKPLLYKAKGKQRSEEMGWFTTKENKNELFSSFIQHVTTGRLKLRSDLLVKECECYVRGATGNIDHVKVAKTPDYSSRGESHGDRVIAMAIAVQAAKDRPLPKVNPKENEVPEKPMDPFKHLAGREQMFAARKEDDKDAWDGRSNWDLATGIDVLDTIREIW